MGARSGSPGPNFDALILERWRAGDNAEQIAALVGISETQMYHVLNRILREACNREDGSHDDD
jgi:hypothetical protein